MLHLYFMPATHAQNSAVLLCVITLLLKSSGDQRCSRTSKRRRLELIQGQRSSMSQRWWWWWCCLSTASSLHMQQWLVFASLHLAALDTSLCCCDYALLELFTPTRKIRWRFLLHTSLLYTNQNYDCILPRKAVEA